MAESLERVNCIKCELSHPEIFSLNIAGISVGLDCLTDEERNSFHIPSLTEVVTKLYNMDREDSSPITNKTIYQERNMDGTVIPTCCNHINNHLSIKSAYFCVYNYHNTTRNMNIEKCPQIMASDDDGKNWRGLKRSEVEECKIISSMIITKIDG